MNAMADTPYQREPRCSFCGKDRSEVHRLIEGPVMFISVMSACCWVRKFWRKKA